MTQALCFFCGAIKFGALCPCETCGQGATGDIFLDITFSDHHYAVQTLEEFGVIIQEINQRTDDAKTRFWTFMVYVATHHPDILTVALPDEVWVRADEILGQCTLPTVTLRRPFC